MSSIAISYEPFADIIAIPKDPKRFDRLSNKVLAFALALSMSVLSVACSKAWITTLDSALAVAAPALINILTIVAVVNGKPIDAALVAKINTDAAALKQLATDFANASAAAAPGVCQQLQAAVGVYQADQQLVLQIAQVSGNAVQQKIILLSSLVISLIGAITAAIPACKATASERKRMMKAAPPINMVVWKAHYNEALTAATGNKKVDEVTPTLVLK